MLTPYKLKGRLQHRDAVRLPLMTDFIVVRQHSSPYVWNHYQVLSLPANPPACITALDQIREQEYAEVCAGIAMVLLFVA